MMNDKLPSLTFFGDYSLFVLTMFLMGTIALFYIKIFGKYRFDIVELVIFFVTELVLIKIFLL